MHDLASKNIWTYRWWRQRCVRIESIRGDAAESQFPDGKLVIYMFNPFGAETMQKVLNNLQYSLCLKPRHTIIVLLWPQRQDQVARLPDMRLVCASHRYQIFQAHAPAAS